MVAGEIDGEVKYFVGTGTGMERWRGGDEGMEEVTAVTSYFILQMDVGGHLFRSRIFMYLLIIRFRFSVDFNLFTDLCSICQTFFGTCSCYQRLIKLSIIIIWRPSC